MHGQFPLQSNEFFRRKSGKDGKKNAVEAEKTPSIRKIGFFEYKMCPTKQEKNFYFLGFMSDLLYLCIKIDYSSFPSKEQDEMKVS